MSVPHNGGMTSPSTVPTLPSALLASIERAGYFPALVADVMLAAVGTETVAAHLVHQETTFDRDVVLRHVTVLALTPTRLVIAHADDRSDDNPEVRDIATATTESIPLSSVRAVMLTHVVEDPLSYRSGSFGRELTLTVGWGTVSRVDLMPASCADPNCEADHGFEGTITGDDLVLRISAAADGSAALEEAMAFSRALSSVVGQGR